MHSIEDTTYVGRSVTRQGPHNALTRGSKTYEEAIAAGRDEGTGGCVCKPNALALDSDGGLPHSDSVKCDATCHNARAILDQKA